VTGVESSADMRRHNPQAPPKKKSNESCLRQKAHNSRKNALYSDRRESKRRIKNVVPPREVILLGWGLGKKEGKKSGPSGGSLGKEILAINMGKGKG